VGTVYQRNVLRAGDADDVQLTKNPFMVTGAID
jgi:hypothetical protein